LQHYLVPAVITHRRVPLEAETKDMGFIVQCEECYVWQHGICMGIEQEEDCSDKYCCELCRPVIHPTCKPLLICIAARLPPQHSLTPLPSDLATRSKGHGKKSKSIYSSILHVRRPRSPTPEKPLAPIVVQATGRLQSAEIQRTVGIPSSSIFAISRRKLSARV
jgi:hypothetical protein